MESIKEVVCNNFNRLIDASPLTKREVAKRIGVSENTLQRWKSGDNTPEMPNLEKLAVVLNVGAMEFFKVDEPTIDPAITQKIASLGDKELRVFKDYLNDLYELSESRKLKNSKKSEVG